MKRPAVEVMKLVARYGERTILEGVDMRVMPGEIRVILGGSGSGKSTLLKHLIGLQRPAGGHVRVLGVDPVTAEEHVWESVLSRIGMLFQGGALLNSMSVYDNVALPILERAPDLPRDVVDEMIRMKLALVGLAPAMYLAPPELSGGMKKRAALARAMACDPELLFCDEPSAGLDPVTAAGLDQLILSLRDRFDMSLVVVTHELASIRTIADRVTMLAGGHVIADDTLRNVMDMDEPVVRSFFDRIGSSGRGEYPSLERVVREEGPR